MSPVSGSNVLTDDTRDITSDTARTIGKLANDMIVKGTTKLTIRHAQADCEFLQSAMVNLPWRQHGRYG